MTSDDGRRGGPGRMAAAPGRAGQMRPAAPPGRAPGGLPNIFRERLAHARETAGRLELSPESTAAVEDAVSHDPYLLDSGILDAMGRVGLGDRTALLMPYAGEGPRRQPHVLGQLSGAALAAQSGRIQEAEDRLVQVERNVTAARGSVRRVRAPVLRPTAVLQPARGRAAGHEPEM